MDSTSSMGSVCSYDPLSNRNPSPRQPISNKKLSPRKEIGPVDPSRLKDSSRSRSNSLVSLSSDAEVNAVACETINKIPQIPLDPIPALTGNRLSLDTFSGNKIIVFESSPSKKHLRLSLTTPVTTSGNSEHSMELSGLPLFIGGNVTINFDNRSTSDTASQDKTIEKKKSIKHDRGFTREDIEKMNLKRADAGQVNKISKMYKQCLRLAGLIPSKRLINIPEARLALCTLSFSDADPAQRLEILDSLLTLLKKDDLKEAIFHKLMNLACDFVDLINKNEIQKAGITVELKLIEIFKVLIECIQIHASKGHFMGITKDTKFNFLEAANAVNKLNRIKDLKNEIATNGQLVEFYISCCLEGLRQLKDDRQELYNLALRIYNLAVAAVDVYEGDTEEGFVRFETALTVKDAHLPNHPWCWYNYLVALRALARDVTLPPSIRNKQTLEIKRDKGTKTEDVPRARPSQSLIFPDSKPSTKSTLKPMIPVLSLITKQYKSLDLKFSMGAIETLYDFALEGTTPEIRMCALLGMQSKKNEYDKKAKQKTENDELSMGLSAFASCKELKLQFEISTPLVHLEKPFRIKANRIIREFAARKLIELAIKSKDPAISWEAKKILTERLKTEKHQYIKDIIHEGLLLQL